MSNGKGDYTITTRQHVDQWDADRQTTVSGWKLMVLWTQTKTLIPVFVPDADYNPTNVDAMIREAGYLDNAIGQLGKANG